MVLGSAMRKLQAKKISSENVQLEPESLQSTQLSLPMDSAQVPDNVQEISLIEKLGISVVVVESMDAVAPAIDQLLASAALLGLDIETTGLNPRMSKIRLVQLYDGKNTVFVFDLLRLGGIDPLRGNLWNKPMVAHNAMFEMKHLMYAGIVPSKIGCSLLADRALNGNRNELRPELCLSSRATLKELAKESMGLEISKELQVSDWAGDLTHAQIEYAALDAVLTAKIFIKQRALLKEGALIRAYEVLRDAQYSVVLMELNGIGFDVERHKARIQGWETESVRLHEEITAILGLELNLNSSKQLGEWLQGALEAKDLEGWMKTIGGKLSTSTPTFKQKEKIHMIFPKIVEYRHMAKKISSFGKGLYEFIDESSKRLYGSFSLGTTATGRMASSKPNMQNIPASDILKYVRSGLIFHPN